MVRLRLSLRVILMTFLVFLNKRDTSSSSTSPSPNQGESYVPANYGVLSAALNKNHKQGIDYCIVHYNGDHQLPESRNQSTFYAVEDLVNHGNVSDNPCAQDNMKFTNFHSTEDGKIMLLSYDTTGVCNISEAVRRVELEMDPYIKGLIFVLPKGVSVSKVHVDPHTSANPSLIIAVMNDRSYQSMMKFKGNQSLEILVYAPPSLPVDTSGRSFDISLVVIWIIATATVVVGCWWSGHVRHELFVKRRCESLTIGEPEDAQVERKTKAIEEEPYLNVTPVNVAIFVICMAAMLSSLYFFYAYLVYIIIGLFVMASILSVFVCCDALCRSILPEAVKSFKVPVFFCCSNKQSHVYQVVILISAATLALTWFITRKQPWSWILQDILGVFFSLNMLRTIRLPSYKIVTVLLSLLFFYDIFFVFLTPYITKSGDSIMVEVATGGGSSGGGEESSSSVVVDEENVTGQRELLPMVIKIPHLSIIQMNSSNPLEVCFRDIRLHSYSLLGFGDVLVPGLLVSYCHAFDLIHGIRMRPYFITACISYGFGLILTFLGLFLMEGMAQPALLYLVPCTLIPPILISWFRNEFKQLWRGPGDGSLTTPIPSAPESPAGDVSSYSKVEFKGKDPSNESNQLILDAASSSSQP